ncbi:MAG: DUF6364 family protein [Saprospiraceae bacterium]|jgi:hypothetical protein
MNTKLTLSLDKAIIERAKIYAREHNVSLSHLIEHLLLRIMPDFKEPVEDKTSIVNELSGIVNLEGIDYKEEQTQYFEEKYR